MAIENHPYYNREPVILKDEIAKAGWPWLPINYDAGTKTLRLRIGEYLVILLNPDRKRYRISAAHSLSAPQEIPEEIESIQDLLRFLQTESFLVTSLYEVFSDLPVNHWFLLEPMINYDTDHIIQKSLTLLFENPTRESPRGSPSWLMSGVLLGYKLSTQEASLLYDTIRTIENKRRRYQYLSPLLLATTKGRKLL